MAMKAAALSFSDALVLAESRRRTGEYGRAAEYYLLAAAFAYAVRLDYAEDLALKGAWSMQELAEGRMSRLTDEL